MIEAVVTILVVSGILYGVISMMIQDGEKRLRAWQDAASSCGLQEEAVSLSMSPQLKARAGAIEVRIEAGGEKGRLTQISVVGPAPPEMYDLKLRPESLFQFAREIEIGDASFDSTFFIEGPPRLVFALLDAETRRLLSRVNAMSQLDLSWGELRANMTDEQLTGVLPLLLDISKRFAPAIEVGRRLAENAMKDPEPGVRLQNLLLLTRELPDDPGTVEALRKACSDPSSEIRLRAAMKLGAEGRDVLLNLAESLEEDSLSAEAVSALGRELPVERTRAILDGALSRRHLQTAYACLHVLGRSGASAVGTLAKVLETDHGELATTAAWALGATGSPAAEPALLQALQREQRDLQLAVAHALGRVGSVAAVLPLKEMNERVWLDPELRQATRQAIAEIQSRVQGAAPGQLSLAGAEAGQLSIAGDEAGQLSLAPDPAGQLSLSEEKPES